VRRQHSTIPWSLTWLALCFLSLRPYGPFQRLVDLCTVPLRVVAELASPLTLLEGSRVAAAERSLAERAEIAAEENVRLLADLGRSALPKEPALAEGRRAVHAEVLGHKDWDHLIVRLRDPRGVDAGMPVAFGDAYVGRIERLLGDSTGQDLALVELATAAGFFVGAAVQAEPGTEPVLMTVGGVVAGKRRHGQRHADVLGLAVHYPSDRTLARGLARVHEHFREEEPWARLSEGLRLGEVRREGDQVLIVPELDYKDGLTQVVVLAPPDAELGSAVPFDTVLYDSSWVRARPLSVGDPSPERDTRKLRVGRRHGVLAGAAVTSIGGHLVGRVLRAGLVTSDVALLGDPGLSLIVVARFDGVAAPQVLGRMLALGRDERTEELCFRWIVRAALPPSLVARGGTLHARLYSGSGDAGLPAGFSFGQAQLPLDVRPGDEVDVRVRVDVEPDAIQTLFVRTLGAPKEERGGDA